MKKFLNLVLCFVMLFAVSACNNSTNETDSLKEEVASLTDEINSLSEEITSLTDELDKLKEKKEAELPDFKDCEIGYKLQVYPNVAFDYKVSDDCVVHIESIRATLTAKNVINAGDVLEEEFYPYEIIVEISGSILPDFAEQAIGIYLTDSYVFGIIQPNGAFDITRTFSGFTKNFTIVFYRCSISL